MVVWAISTCLACREVWAASAAFLAARLPDLRLLPVDSPELFFAYMSGEFGAFGLGAAARWILAGVVGLAAVLVAVERVRWRDAQLAVLVVLLSIAAVNTVTWQGRWSGAQAPLRRTGEVAQLLCAPASIVAVSSPQSFPGLYNAMAAVPRIVPLTLLQPDAFAAHIAGLPSGACVLTNVPAPHSLGPPVFTSGGVALHRAP